MWQQVGERGFAAFPSSPGCLRLGAAGKMLLWFLLLLLLPLPAFLRPGAGSSQAPLAASRRGSSELSDAAAAAAASRALPLAAHLCEGYSGADGRLHAAFFCPRLSDAPADAYCCQPGGRGALKSCCPRPERPRDANASAALPAGPRSQSPPPLPLLAVGLYGGLILALGAADLLHFLFRRRRLAVGRSAVTWPAQAPPPEVPPVASA